MSKLGVRYIVDDVAAAIEFYTRHLGFELEAHPAPGFAALQRGDLRLLLNAPGSGGAGQRSAGGVPTAGGWNRFQLEVQDLDDFVQRLKAGGAPLRNEIVAGKGGRQILIEDPAGNVVELFEPAAH